MKKLLISLTVVGVSALALMYFYLRAPLPSPGREQETVEIAGQDWPGFGGPVGEQHFSPLEEINPDSVSQLGLAWFIDLPPGNSVSSPVAVDGVLYFVTRYGVVTAADARTGRQLWEYDPESPKAAGKKLRFGWGSRGIAWWNGKIYVGTQDGRLIAIDAKSGKPVWSVLTVEPGQLHYITGAPRAFDGKVIIGFGGADVGPLRGYVTTYDANTGKQLWRWHTVPGNPEKEFENDAMRMAAKTWSGEWWKYGGGGSVWNAITHDPETDTVFIGVGNGAPWSHKLRSEGRGDNLFLASIVALDGNSGAYKWHYQTNPGETWDYTTVMDMALGELRIDGRNRKVLMTAPKNGFFYVIDRTNGKLISAQPFAKVNWASKIDLVSGRPVENPQARYPDGAQFTVWPGANGAHNWFPMAYSPQTQLVYIPVLEDATAWSDNLEVSFGAGWRPGAVPGRPEGEDPLRQTSRLDAWDPVSQKRIWSHPTPGLLNGGVAATGGNLVFQGQLDGQFRAYAADTGRLLWTFQVGAPVIAPPISYAVNGRQYITVLTGMGGSRAMMGEELASFAIDYRTQARRVLTFVIGGRAALPPKQASTFRPISDPEYRSNQLQAGRGAMTFSHCVQCHGRGAVAGGAAPDLRASAVILNSDSFRNVVKEGGLVENGMPQFEELTEEQLSDVRQYLRSRAREWQPAGTTPVLE